MNRILLRTLTGLTILIAIGMADLWVRTHCGPECFQLPSWHP